MKRSISLRLRVTLVCGVLLAVCCLLLTVSHTYSAYEMADAIEAIPLQPSRTIGACDTGTPAPAPMAEVNLPARETFRMQSVAAMAVIVVSGCLMVYWLTGKALAPLHRLDEQIRGRTVSDLDAPLPVPASADEVAGLTVSFNQMSQTLSRAFQQQKQFAQCAAHELRTPLAVLKTRMSLFRKKGLCGTPETAALLDVLEEQTERLSTLVSDLLSLANPDDLECSERVDLSRLLARAAGTLEEAARAQNIAIRLETGPVTVSGNAVLLERALFNLMENAVKYNRPGGTMTVRTMCAGTCARVEVCDEGVGIPPEFREQIFEPFFRVDKSRSRQLGGAGLGLSLVRAIAELHGGSVRAEAVQDRGSRFLLVLPRLLEAP